MPRTDPPAEPALSHDRLLKEFLRRFLEAVLRLFFPAEAAELDFATLRFPDKELIINLPGQVLRITDVLAEVSTVRGEPKVIIVHVEVESRDKRTLSPRMFEYYSLIRVITQLPVLPLALVLIPHAGGLGWQTYSEQLFGQTLVSFRYGQVGLRDLPGERYLALDDPVAAALAVLMRTPKRKRAALKLAALQTVERSALSEGDKHFLVNMIGTYLPQAELGKVGAKTMQALQEAEMTWLERAEYRGEQRGEQRGELRGELRGEQKVLLRLLQVRFGDLPDSLVQAIQSITDLDVLDALSVRVLTAASLDEFAAALPAPQP